MKFNADLKWKQYISFYFFNKGHEISLSTFKNSYGRKFTVIHVQKTAENVFMSNKFNQKIMNFIIIDMPGFYKGPKIGQLH